MSLLSTLGQGLSEQDFYRFQAANGGGFMAHVDTDTLVLTGIRPLYNKNRPYWHGAVRVVFIRAAVSAAFRQSHHYTAHTVCRLSRGFLR